MKKQNSPNTKIWTVCSVFFFLLLVLSEGTALYQAWKLAILPPKFFFPLVLLVLLITLVLMAMMFPRIGRHLKTRCIGRRITAYVLSVLIAAASFFGGHVLGLVNRTFDHITDLPETVSAYVDVFVRADDPAENIEDVSGYTFAVTDSFDPDSTRKAIDDLSALWGTPAKTTTYPSAFEMVDALLHREVDGIIMNESFLEIFRLNEDYQSFDTDTKMLHRHSIVQKADPADAPTLSTDPTETTAPDEGVYTPFICYLSGSDTREQMLAPARSDVNILAVVNPQTRQILLISTPRDYFISNPALGNRLDKLTHCGIYGVDCSVKALSQLYEAAIDYTAKINFVGFETLIDSIGGVDIYSPNGDGVLLDAGNNHMDGAEALYFARDRYDYAAGDNARGQHQMMVIKAVVEKMASGAIITGYSDILKSLEGMFITSMPSEKISALIKMQLDDMKPWTVHSFASTGTGGNDRPASMSQNAYVMYPNQTSVKKAMELIDRVLADEILSEQDLLY